MQYSPKLKMVMDEIKAIVDKHDVGAIVALHTPGHTEFMNQLSPSYSIAKRDPATDQLRFYTKLENYNGDKQAQLADIISTYNLFQNFRDYTGQHYLLFDDLIQRIKTAFAGVLEFEEGGANFTGHTDQNN